MKLFRVQVIDSNGFTLRDTTVSQVDTEQAKKVAVSMAQNGLLTVKLYNARNKEIFTRKGDICF